MIAEAAVVVIGSGAFGSSLAYHLAALGQRDVALVDRHAIASQTSPRAAGLTQQIRPDPAMTRLAMLSVRKLERFARETGEPFVFHQPGSVKMARTAEDERQIHAEIAAGQRLGLEIHQISARELASLAPFANARGVRAMWHTPSDVYLEPGQLPLGYARAAERLGVTVMPHTPVTSLLTDRGRIAGVMTAHGPIRAEVVVDAAGAWARRLGEAAGARVPIVPMRHQLMITAPLPGIEPTHAICRVIDANVYIRPDHGGLMVGGYEAAPLVWDMNGAAETFQIGDLPLDLGVLRRLADSVRDQFPMLQNAPIREHRGGLPTMTADGRPIVGPVPGAAGMFVATGCCVGGLSISPAVGQLLAEWIVEGTTPELLAPLSIERFGTAVSSDLALEQACVRTYAHSYAAGWADETPPLDAGAGATAN